MLRRLQGPIVSALLASAIVSGCDLFSGTSPKSRGVGDLTPDRLTAESQPGWVNGGEHPRYPSQRYLRGVGASPIKDSEAEARQNADDVARGEIALYLRSEVQREVTSRTREQGRVTADGADSVVELELNDLTRVVGSETLEGAEIVDRYRSPTGLTVYSFAAMDRAVAARNIAARVERMRQEAEAQLALARELQASGQRARTFGTLLGAYDLFLQAQVADSAHRVLVGKPAPTELPDRAAELRGQLEAFRVDLHVEVAQGQGQRAAPGTPLLEPIVLRATLRDGGKAVPVRGVTFSLRPAVPGAAELSAQTVVTDEKGEASFTVPVVHPGDKEASVIIASLDAARIGSFEVPDVRIQYSVPTRDTLRVLVVVDEIALGRASPSPVVALGIQDALRTAGFPVVSADGYVAELGRDKLLYGRLEDLRPVLGADVDILLRGRAEARRGDRSFGNLPTSRSSAKLQALDLVSGRALSAFETRDAIEARPNLEDAAQRSLEILSGDAGKEVVARLRKVLKGPAS